MPAIRTESIRKKFGRFVAVNDVSLEVPEDQTFDLLGPNGAGKSTRIRILATLLPLTSGKAFVAGHDVRKKPNLVRKAIGVVRADHRS